MLVSSEHKLIWRSSVKKNKYAVRRDRRNCTMMSLSNVVQKYIQRGIVHFGEMR
jgi:hypothetical protein